MSLDYIEKNRLKMLVCCVFAFVLLFSLLQTAAKAEQLDPEGTELVDITTCAGLLGHYTAIPGNAAHPVAAYDPTTNYIAYLSESEDTWNKTDDLDKPSRVVLTKYDGTNCTTPIELTSNTRNPGNASHNAPSVFVDSNEYVYVTTGLGAGNADTLNAPFVLRSTNADDITAFEEAERMRLWQGAELHGFTMQDGSVLFGGTDIHSRFDIAKPYEPGDPSPDYLYPASRQVVTSVHGEEWSISGLCAGNRFTKGVFTEGVGTDTNLYITWGYSSSGKASKQCWEKDQDSQHYSTDSHEMFFAYSDDEGITWKNIDGTKVTESASCVGPVSTSVCKNNPEAGILFNDDDYRITETRQRYQRKLWADPDGTIYISFVKSRWCDEGVCNDPDNLVSTNPGALKLLKFQLGDTIDEVEELTVNSNFHTFNAGIRKDAGKLYIWAHEEKGARGAGTGDIYEYVSSDDGLTWSRTRLNPDEGIRGCNRTHGESYNPFLKNSVRFIFACRDSVQTDLSHVFMYRRSFDHSTELPTGWMNADIGSAAVAGDSSYWEDGSFMLHGAGTGVGGADDNHRFVYQDVHGDFEMNVSVLEIEEMDSPAQAGIMVRESTASDAKHVSLGLPSDGKTVEFSSRTTAGSEASSTSIENTITAPYTLKLTRIGNEFSGFISGDGVNWKKIHSSTVSLDSEVIVGMATASGNDNIRMTSTFADASISGDVAIPPTDEIQFPKGALPLPEPWTSENIGTGHRDGAAGYLSNGTHFIVGTGTGIGQTSDRLHYSYQEMKGDFEISARILDTGLNEGQSGVMIREMSLDNARMAFIGLNAGSDDVSFITRSSLGGASEKTSIQNVTSPHWVKLVRSGNTINGYISEDGINWTLVGTASVPMTNHVLVGYSHSSGINDKFAQASFANISLLKAPWTHQMIGEAAEGNAIHIDGFVQQSDQSVVINGSGQGVSGTEDDVHFVYQEYNKDITVITKIDKLGDTNQAAQAGLMIRDSLDADSKQAFLTVLPNGGIALKERATTGGESSEAYLNDEATGPYWLKLQKAGDTITAHYSNDGESWTSAGTATITVSESFYVGLAATSPNSQKLSNWEFSDTSVVPYPWAFSDIGDVGLPGKVTYSDGTFTVKSTGRNIWGTADEFHYVYQEINQEDVQIVVKVESVSNTHPVALAGPMFRDTLDPGSKNFVLGSRVDSYLNSKYRAETNGETKPHSRIGGKSAPIWLMLQKEGDIITSFQSADGIDWTQVGAAYRMELESTFYAGFAIQPGTNTEYNTTIISNASIGEIVPVETDYEIPVQWTSDDIGNVGIPGSANGVADSYTVNGSGNDIWGSADEFQYMHQSLSGDGSIVARIASVTGGQAGIMMRESLTEGSKHAFLSIRGNGGIRYKSRTETDGATSNVIGDGSAPYWVKLVRSGDTFEGYRSADGENWTLVDSITIPMNREIHVGLAMTSQDNQILHTADFDHVAVSQEWYNQDIGAVGIAGSVSKDNGVYTVTASGDDIYGSADEFHYVHQTLAGDGTIEARMVTIENGGQSGLMMRESLDEGSAHAFLSIRAIGGVKYKARLETDGLTANASASGSAPHWIRLVRTGNTFDGYHSADGENWSFVASYTITMGNEIHVGLAVTSHSNDRLNTTEYDNVSISQ